MMRQGWGRVINVTTSLGTMINAGNPTYGPSKAALEALSAIMAKDLEGTGVTVNVLVPGGATNTPMISDEAGFNRAELIQPEVMAPPMLWLVSDAATKVTDRRFLVVHWDTRLPSEEAGREGWGVGGVDEHLAGSERNWGYAAYELDQLRETFADVADILPKYRDLLIPDMIRSTVKEPLSALDRAIQAKDASEFSAAYRQLTALCNTCHEAYDCAVIVMQTAAGSTFPDQDFRSPTK